MLLIDVGNTRLKAAFANDLERHWAVNRDSAVDAVAQLLGGCDRQPQRVVISCVGDVDLAQQLQVQCLSRWGLTAQQLIGTAEFATVGGLSIKNGYTDPGQLGIDRWAAVVAAWHRIRGAVVVVDCGTAVTIDTVGANGQHLGGVIFPGLQLSVASFYQNTPNQPDQAGVKRDAYAINTAEAVGCGVRWAVTGGINELLRELFTQLPPTTPVLLTGGDAAELAPFLSGKIEQVPQLVFEGMALIAGFNQDD